MIKILLLFTILIIIFQFIIIILLIRKGLLMQDVLSSFVTLYNNITNKIEYSDKKLKEIDIKGSFKADDEVGYFFENIKDIQSKLNEFAEIYNE